MGCARVRLANLRIQPNRGALRGCVTASPVKRASQSVAGIRGATLQLRLHEKAQGMNMRGFITIGASLAALAVLAGGCTTTSDASGDAAAQRKAIDAGDDSALTRP
jgi:hypothetical protein